MSVYAQNFAYIVGEKKPGAKENVMSKEKYESLCRAGKKYLNQGKSETEKRTAKQ